MSDAIEQYLDQLFLASRLAPQATRRLLREAEDHLRHSQTGLLSTGMPEADAAAEAVRRFGTVRALLVRAGQEDPRGALVRTAVSLGVGGLWLLALGLVAIGASGVLAWAFGSWAGREYVSGNPPGVAYTEERCQQLLRLEPDAPDCLTAATEHHFFETVAYRLAAGGLGVVVALAALASRPLARRGPDIRGLVGAAGVLMFGAAAVLMLAEGGANGPTADGAGALVSAGLVSLAAAAGCGLLLFAWLRRSGYGVLAGARLR
jgi:hypothetical protein